MSIVLRSKILIVGSNGFVGRHLSKFFLEKGFEVSGISRAASNHSFLSNYYQVSLLEPKKLELILSKIQPEFIIHLAGNKDRSNSDPKVSYEENLFGSLNLISACKQVASLKKFIFFGTCDEYGTSSTPYTETTKESPVNFYGLSKLAVTNHLLMLKQTTDFPCIVLRPSVIYGPGQSTDMFIPTMITTLLKGDRMKMSPGEQTRDFIFIDDIVNAVNFCLESKKMEVFNLGSSTSVKMITLAKKIADCMNINFEKNLDVGAVQYRKDEIMNYSVSSEKAHSLLSWTPKVSLEDGLLKTIEYYKSNYSK